MKFNGAMLFGFAVIVSCSTPGGAAERRTVQSRVFYQDEAEAKIYWTDMGRAADAVSSVPAPAEIALVAGFPKLDPESQSLVQMKHVGRYLLVGVRDDEDGNFQSGWVLIDSGVQYESHGDHWHWYYDQQPKVVAKVLDDQQGNPAHVYVYDDVFYIANDRKNGFTRLDPSKISSGDDESAIRRLATFTESGGGHITIAATDKFVASTWMDRGGDKDGQVDIVVLPKSSEPTAGTFVRSLKMLSGGLHGAETAGGKFFFAPSEGVNWIPVNDSLTRPDANVFVHHIDLGTDGDKPLRTGAFTKVDDNVLLVSGSGAATFLGVIDADQASPQLMKVTVPVTEGSRAFGPIILRPRRQSPIALLFHDKAGETSENAGKVSIVQLDPNKDSSFADAKLLKDLVIGPSNVVGHSGHHDADGDEVGRFAWISNPGNATVQVLALEQMNIAASYPVPGKPGRLVAIGGPGRGSSNDGK